jgi:hypothetical protein
MFTVVRGALATICVSSIAKGMSIDESSQIPSVKNILDSAYVGCSQYELEVYRISVVNCTCAWGRYREMMGNAWTRGESGKERLGRNVV